MVAEDSANKATRKRRAKKTATKKKASAKEPAAKKRAAKKGEAAAKKAAAKRPSRYPEPSDREVKAARELGMRIGPAPLGQKSEPVDPSLGTTAAASTEPHRPLIERDDKGRIVDPEAGTTFESLLELLRSDG